MIHRFLAQTFHEVVTFIKNITFKADVSIDGNLSVAGTVPDSRPYKVYTARLSQSGTNAPVATVLENTLGFIPIWQYSVAGSYYFDNIPNGGSIPIRIETRDDGTLANGILLDDNTTRNNLFEFRIYGEYAGNILNYFNTWAVGVNSAVISPANTGLTGLLTMAVYMMNE